MRILYLSPRQSWPANTGAKLRDYHLARAIGEQGELTWIFYADPAEAVPQAHDLPFCDKILAIPRPQLYGASKLVKGMLGKWSLPVVNYTSPQMVQAIAGMLSQRKFDAIHVDSIHLAASLEAASDAPGKVFYNWHNIESELMQRYSEGEGSGARRLYAKVTARRLWSDEKHILSTAQGHIVCSERERAALRKRAPDARIAVIENGVDTTMFENLGNPTGQRDRLVFVGSMSYHANVDAAVWFTENVWPGLREKFPHWKLALVGANPGPQVRALSERPGVEVTGTVPDVRPYYAAAAAAVVPLRIGGGTRLKILEAMAAGVPVVSTPEGAEGLEVSPGKDFLLASSAGDWGPLLDSLSRDGRAEQLVNAGKNLVRERYDWNAIGRKLTGAYREWLT